MLKDCDVLIIGGGPVGLTCAAELIRQGISNFQIVDKRLEPEIKSTGTGMNPPTLEVLESYGIASELTQYGVKGSFSRLVDGNYKLSNNLNFGNLLSKHSKYTFLGVEQWFTEKALNGYLLRNNQKILRGYNITDLKDLGDVVLVDYYQNNDASQTIHQIKAKFVIAADGARSPTRKRLGIKYEGTTNKRSCLVIHLKTDTFQFPKDSLLISFDADGGYFSMALPNSTMAFAIPLLEHEDKYLSDKVDNHGYRIPSAISDDECLKIMTHRKTPVTSLNNVIWKAHFRANNRVASSYWNKNRIFLAGDAVHCSDPMAGLGMNYGIQDAANLGWKLAFVLKGYASKLLLETYETEMRPNGKIVTEEGRIAERNFQPKPKILAAIISNIFFPVFQFTGIFDRMFLHTLNMDIRHKSQLTKEDWSFDWNISSIWSLFRYLFVRRIKAGEKFKTSLHCLLPDSDLFLKSTKFKVLFFEGLNAEKNSQLNQIGKQILESNNFVDHYQVVPQAKQELYTRCGVLGECMMIIRPDQFIGLRSHRISMTQVNDYFAVLQ
ncbi:hypothetical protein HDV02_001564 [Globomyces sp. JEL0801]|nr:hypothetical protein HDV02_001564 [Globomyces sp. JEL0801]